MTTAANDGDNETMMMARWQRNDDDGWVATKTIMTTTRTMTTTMTNHSYSVRKEKKKKETRHLVSISASLQAKSQPSKRYLSVFARPFAIPSYLTSYLP